MRKIFVIVLAALLFLCPVMECQASETLGTEKVTANNQTRMRYIDGMGASIHIMDDGTATTTANAFTYESGVDHILVVAELQQLRDGSWYTLRTYRYFTADTEAIISQTCQVEEGYYYRVVNTTTMYAGNDSETEVLESPSWNFFVPGT